MACNDQFRHVCLKDLEDYIKRDEYFSDFSDEEKAIIRKNLGLTASGESDYNPTIFSMTHKEMTEFLQDHKKLNVGYIYKITDFQTIYKEGDQVCGLDHIPSKVYWMYLRAVGESTFDSRVFLVDPDGKVNSCSKWIVEYDITRHEVSPGIYDKGQITYLKDQYGNEAYFDFKNRKVLKTVEELKSFPRSYDEDTYFYTFDNDGEDGTEHGWSNNHLSSDCSRNIFLNDTFSVYLEPHCHDNVFTKGCINSRFGSYTFKNIFINAVNNCSGTVSNAIIGSGTETDPFKRIDDFSTKYAITQLDEDTETFQVKMYGKQDTGNS